MCSRRHGGGRVRSTTPAEDRYIVLSAKRNRRTTAQQVANQFLAASGKQISRKIVARRLRGGGLHTRRPVVCVPLTRQHRTARLQWCREHHNWTEQDWACVLFSDESRFSLSSDCRRQLIWRESGTPYRPENIQEKDRYPTCSIMMWAGIMINGRTRLHVVANGTMTGQRYIDEVLLHVRLFRGAVGDKFVFMDDRATCHRTLADALGRQVAGRNYPPTNKNTLIRALTEEWDKLPQQLLDNVVQSMVVGEGGEDGWQVVDDKGDVEWKIEYDDGEWRVTSTGEIPVDAEWADPEYIWGPDDGSLSEEDEYNSWSADDYAYSPWVDPVVYVRGIGNNTWPKSDAENQGAKSSEQISISEIFGSSGHEKVPTRGKPGLERPGRPRGERIVRQALVDPTVTRLMIRADAGVAIVPQTISRHLAEANLKSKRPFRALPLTPEHRQLRLQWCQARSMWNVTDWQKVVFSDESRFVLGTDDNHVRVWRRPGERYKSPTLFYVTLSAQLV
ncbi:uncharacterized protein TNCV_2861051 [Trichonephila clavipes]|nr:uncharacterized protein TNCV_2861051 [Trichonephila clavipes]